MNPTPRTVCISFTRVIEIHLAAQPRDVHVDHVVERRRPRRFLPDVTRQRLARHDLALVAHQEFEQLELTNGQVDRPATAQHLARDQIHLEVADREPRRIRHAAAAHQRTDAGEQFGEGERLDEVVVRAGVEAGHAVLQRVARGEDEHRRLHAALAQRAQDLKAVAPRQRQVEQHHVERLRVDAEERRFAGALDHHVVPFIFEAFAQGIGHLLFVLNDEDSHQL